SAELKYKALRGYVIGSRTKGESETKEFVGNVILQRLDINDISYIRRRFYRYTNLGQGQGSNSGANDTNIPISNITVYLDNRDVARSSASYTLRADNGTGVVDLSLLIPNATSYVG